MMLIMIMTMMDLTMMMILVTMTMNNVGAGGAAGADRCQAGRGCSAPGRVSAETGGAAQAAGGGQVGALVSFLCLIRITFLAKS